MKVKKNKFKYDKDNGTWVVVPKIIYDNTDLNYTDKIVLSWIHGYKSTWNSISTETIATALNLTRATINEVVRKLTFLELIEQRYYLARKRVFRSLLPDTNDAFSLITTEVLNDESISPAYKITMGVLIAAALGENNFLEGFNFNNIEMIAKRLNLSVSSVYRHLSVLTKEQLIAPKEYGRYLIKPIDRYSLNYHNNQKRVKQLKEASEQLGGVVIDDATNELLERIYNAI